MNTKVTIVKTFSKKENLVVLAEKSNLGWTSDLLGKEEVQYLKNAIKNEIHQVVFPKGNQIIVVQILKG